MKQTTEKVLTGERAAYGSKDQRFVRCTFENGESPLKECRNIEVSQCIFGWKYPLWYGRDIVVDNTEWLVTARSGVWYTQNLEIHNSLIGAPKQFRRCENLVLNNCQIPLAEETLWKCKNVRIADVTICGDYFGFNCENVQLKNVHIDGNYCFDGGKNIYAENCVFDSKDSFWNCENVTIVNSTIVGEYLAWNSKNIKFVNCILESHQGFCYIDTITLENCQVNNTDLCFELCTDVDATITTVVDSIKNPISGTIKCKGIGELILDSNVIDPAKVKIEVEQ